MKPKDTKKDPKKQEEVVEEQEPEPQPEKEKNLERFIHVTTYSDSKSMGIIRDLFEEINQAAFELRSVKEIYTKALTDEERDNNEIDYVSGVQILDKERRITIIEGITGKGIKKFKDALPKNQMNNDEFKIFADSNVLFNKRIYSKFDLQLKYIKLRDTLDHILTTYDIYTKANKYRPIYDAFLNYGSILKCDTMKDIAEQNLFSDADSLLFLERKYADIITEEDMTGIKKVKKRKKRQSVEDLMDKSTVKSLSLNNDRTREPTIKLSLNEIRDNEEEKSEKMKIRPKLDTHNLYYEETIKNLIKPTISQTIKKNKDYILKLETDINEGKIKRMDKFCLPDHETEYNEPIYFYSGLKKNFYQNYFHNLREKYCKDKNHYYAYSNIGLTQTFPMIEPFRNEEYIAAQENKKKWVCDKDFNRYSPPPKEKYYLPKINNPL